jgi:serine/threonine protein kinase/tetratricopeptide (TPR) repeat protein
MRNRYQKQDKIGSGGMATVYRGLDTQIQRPIAIKEVRPNTEQEEADFDPLQLFLNEAHRMAEIRHPNVLIIHDVVLDQNPPWMIMELASGTLHERIQRGAIRPPEEALAIFRQLVAGLAEIHRKEIVHRDIKPENIFLCGEQYKIGDFGIAKHIDDKTRPLYTPKYAAPEVHLRLISTMAADVYSLGLVGHEIFLGTKELERQARASRKNFGEVRIEDGAGDAIPWTQWHMAPGALLPPLDQLVDIPTPVAHILTRMVRKEAVQRYASCIEVLAALDSLEERHHRAGPITNEGTETIDEPPIDKGRSTKPYGAASQGGRGEAETEPYSGPAPEKPRSENPSPDLGFIRQAGGRRRLLQAGGANALLLTLALTLGPRLFDGGGVAALRQQGLEALAAGQWNAAVTDLEAVLASTQEDMEATLACAKAHYKLTNYQRAEELLTEVEKHGPRQSDVPLYLGLIDLARNRMSNALRQLERAVELAEPGAEAAFHLGYAHYRLGNYPAARTAFERFIRAQKEQTPLTERARAFLQNIERRGTASNNVPEPWNQRSIYGQSLQLEGFRRASTHLDTFRGNVLVLHLWASWCQPCTQEMPSLAHFFENDYQTLADRGLSLVTVSNDFTKPDLARFVDAHLTPSAERLPIFWDPSGRLSDRLEFGSALPQTLVVSRDGHILDRKVGMLDWQSKSFLHQLETYL